eukprot:scaffold265281_cov31-Prasinocladus_malaysianus.AAC.1
MGERFQQTHATRMQQRKRIVLGSALDRAAELRRWHAVAPHRQGGALNLGLDSSSRRPQEHKQVGNTATRCTPAQVFSSLCRCMLSCVEVTQHVSKNPAPSSSSRRGLLGAVKVDVCRML